METMAMYPSQRAMSQTSSSHYSTPYESPEMARHVPTMGPSRKRSRPREFSYDDQALQQRNADTKYLSAVPVQYDAQPPEAWQSLQPLSPATAMQGLEAAPTPIDPRARLPSGTPSFYVPSQRPSPQRSEATQSFQEMQPRTHHHHRLPPQRTSKSPLVDLGGSLRDQEGGPPSMVGQTGMPSAAARPHGPKLKFTAEDDALLVELKETKDLTWKQIADFFPGRSSGTLQVRYCTKLKAKTTAWTDEMVRGQDATDSQ